MEIEVARLQKLIHQLLLLAQLKQGVEFPMNHTFDLAVEAASVCGDAEFEANVAGRDLVLESSEPFVSQSCLIEGCGELLQGALDNVVRNAIRFAPEGNEVGPRTRSSWSRYMEDGFVPRIARAGPHGNLGNPHPGARCGRSNQDGITRFRQ